MWSALLVTCEWRESLVGDGSVALIPIPSLLHRARKLAENSNNNSNALFQA